MFSMPIYPDLRMKSYIRAGWEGKETSFTVTLVKNTTERYVFQNHQSSSSHGTQRAWILPRQPNGKNLREIITWCNRRQCGLQDHILLWWVWERPGAASLMQTTASHSSPVWITVYLDRKAARYNIIINCCCSMSVTCLWLWRGEEGGCVFPDGQVSKSRDKLKPNA